MTAPKPRWDAGPIRPPNARDWLEAALARARREEEVELAAAIARLIREHFGEQKRRAA